MAGFRSQQVTRTQLDRVGRQLRIGKVAEADLRALDNFRRSFRVAYEHVVEVIRREPGMEPTGRPAKSTASIAEKLRRDNIRLTQMQDIAGCRLVVRDIAEQERALTLLRKAFAAMTLIDRREHASHGYRAAHVVVSREGKAVEIQVRTLLQHRWAEISEKFSDVVDASIKYGGGPEDTRDYLAKTSEMIRNEELAEIQVLEVLSRALVPEAELPAKLRRQVAGLREDLDAQRMRIAESLEEMTVCLGGSGSKK